MLMQLQDGRDGIKSGRVSSLPAAFFETAQAAGQPPSRTSASAAKQEWDELKTAASPVPPQATGTAGSHQPQIVLSSQHKASADAEVQQSDSVRRSNTKLWDLDQQEALCHSTGQQQQQQCSFSHLHGPLEFQSGGKERQGSCRGVSFDPVQATDRALLEHCAAGG